jgi:hypothetical protein
MDHKVFIQTNHKQITGAIVAEYALRRYSHNNDKFDVQIIHKKDYPWFDEHEGKLYLRDGLQRKWLNDDLQSFTLTRFMPPELMGYQGRAVVIDPDIFAASDIWELLSRDMQGKAIMCRSRSGTKGFKDHCMATSVMLLDCAKLTHWKVREQFADMFDFKRDYMHWICLRTEDRDTIGLFEKEWNDFDHFTPATKMLHTTKRKTQPWKTGLPRTATRSTSSSVCSRNASTRELSARTSFASRWRRTTCAMTPSRCWSARLTCRRHRSTRCQPWHGMPPRHAHPAVSGWTCSTVGANSFAIVPKGDCQKGTDLFGTK